MKLYKLLILGFIVLVVSRQNIQQSNNSSTIYENSDQLAKKVIAEIPVSEFKTIYDGEDYIISKDNFYRSLIVGITLVTKLIKAGF